MIIRCNYKYLQILIFVLIIVHSRDYLNGQQLNNDASFVFAKKLYNDKLYDLAAEQFHQFAEINYEHAKAPESLLMAGKCYLKTESYAEAKKEFISLITKYPDAKNLDEAQFLLAECFEKNSEIQSAAKSYRQLQVFYPKSPLAVTSLIKSAQLYQQSKDYQTATENLYHVIEFYPHNKKVNEARQLLAEIFEDQKKHKQSILELDKLISLTEKGIINANAIYKKGHIELMSGHIQEAEDILNEVIYKYNSSNETDIRQLINHTYNDLAAISRKKGFFQQSIDYLKKIQNVNENHSYVFNIANNFFSLENYSAAIQNYEIITNKNFDDTYLLESFFQLGKSYAYLQDFVNSSIAFNQLIEICSDRDSLSKKDNDLFKKAYLHISENYIKTKNPNLAIKYLKDYLKTYANEKDKDLIVFKICTLYENEIGDIERAIRAYYDFIDEYLLSRLIDDAQFNLAQCFEKKKEYGQAIIEYQQLINNYPASDYTDAAEKRIKYINNYFQTDNNILNQFGRIIGQLTATQSNMLSNFNLGLIYFKELKDYLTAKTLFRKSYSNKNEDQVQVDKIIFYLGRAYQLLGEKKQFHQTYLDSAFYNYEILIENYPESDFVDDAAYYQIEILKNRKITNSDSLTVEKLKNMLTNFRYHYNDSVHINSVNLLLGNLLIKMGINTSVDSMDIFHCLDAIINDKSESRLIDKAEFSLALFYYKMGETSHSENKLKNFLNNYSTSSLICKAYSLLSRIYEDNGDYKKAVYYLKYIAQNLFYSQCSEQTNLKIADLFKKQNKFSEAQSYYQTQYKKINATNILQMNKESYQTILFNLANISIIKKNKKEATKYLDEYISKYPQGKYADIVLFELGKLHSVNNFDLQKKAIDYFQRIKNDFSSSALADSALIRLGEIYFEQQDYEKALAYYTNYMKKVDPETNCSFPFSRKVISLYRLGKISQADNQLKIFKKQYKSEKHLIANMLLEKGDYYIKTKNLKLAEKVFKDVKSDYKNSHDGAKAEYLLGKLNFILNKDEEALEIMSKLIERYPEDKILPDVYITLGNFYYLQSKQIENALLSYKKATEQNGIEESKLKIALNNLIKCYSDLGMREQAISAIRKYLKRFPTAKDVFEKKVHMGVLYYELKEFDVALNLLKKLKYEADVENEPRIQYWIGECYFGKGEFKRAVSEYLKVVYLSKPTKLNWRVTAQYQAGVAYVKAGEPKRAIEIFAKIITEQGAGSVFGKPAQKKIDEISKFIK